MPVIMQGDGTLTGKVQTFEGLPVERRLTITEGNSEVVRSPLHQPEVPAAGVARGGTS